MAKDYGFTLRQLQALECDQRWEGHKTILKAHEWCWLMRRRHGLQAKDVAKVMGICPWWLSQMERGKVNCARLVEHWTP